mmetsp:Transcript_76959/g.184362  ORF Transcript_76959/g.184362 Transcript_76959/m.184362 type:complete len:290 (-) Transcript_76959:1016-1885(-)
MLEPFQLVPKVRLLLAPQVGPAQEEPCHQSGQRILLSKMEHVFGDKAEGGTPMCQSDRILHGRLVLRLGRGGQALLNLCRQLLSVKHDWCYRLEELKEHMTGGQSTCKVPNLLLRHRARNLEVHPAQQELRHRQSAQAPKMLVRQAQPRQVHQLGEGRVTRCTLEHMHDARHGVLQFQDLLVHVRQPRKAVPRVGDGHRPALALPTRDAVCLPNVKAVLGRLLQEASDPRRLAQEDCAQGCLQWGQPPRCNVPNTQREPLSQLRRQGAEVDQGGSGSPVIVLLIEGREV